MGCRFAKDHGATGRIFGKTGNIALVLSGRLDSMRWWLCVLNLRSAFQVPQDFFETQRHGGHGALIEAHATSGPDLTG